MSKQSHKQPVKSIGDLPKANSGHLTRSRGVVPGGAGGAMATPDFGRSVNPILTRGDRLCPPQYYEPPGFLDLATGLGFELETT